MTAYKNMHFVFMLNMDSKLSPGLSEIVSSVMEKCKV